MDGIQVSCEGCSKRYKIAPEKIGPKLKCPACGASLRHTMPPAEHIAVAEVVSEESVVPAVVEDAIPEAADPFGELDLSAVPEASIPQFAGPTRSDPLPQPQVSKAPGTKQDAHVTDVEKLLSDANRNTGPWQHGRYLVVQGSQRLPQRCIRSDGRGEIEVREDVKYLSLPLRIVHVIAAVLMGVVGVFLVSVLTQSAVEHQTVRFYMTRTRYWIREAAKWTVTALAIIGTVVAIFCMFKISMHFAYYEKPLVARGQPAAPTAAEALPTVYPITLLITFGMVLFSGLVMPWIRPIWVHRIEPDSGRIWLTGPCRRFRNRFSELGGSSRPPLHTVFQQLLIAGLTVLVVACFTAKTAYEKFTALSNSKQMLISSDQAFDLNSSPTPNFQPPPKAKPWREFFRIDAKLGVAQDEPGFADRLIVIYPSRPAEKSRAAIFLTPPGGTLLTGSTLTEPSEAMLDLVRHGFVIVMYECDGYLDANSERLSALPAAAQKYSQSMAGLINGRNAISYATSTLPGIDPKRFYTVGHSSAGRQALMLAAHDDRISICGSIAGVCNSNHMVNTLDTKILNRVIPGCKSWLRRISPATHAARIKCPSYFVHSINDEIVRIQHSTTMVDLLRKGDVFVETLNLETDDHYQETAQIGYQSFARWLTSMQRVVSSLGTVEKEIGRDKIKQLAANDRAKLDRISPPQTDFPNADSDAVTVHRLRSESRDAAIDWDTHQIVLTNDYAGFATYSLENQLESNVWEPKFIQSTNGPPISMVIKSFDGHRTLFTIAEGDVANQTWKIHAHHLETNEPMPTIEIPGLVDQSPKILAAFDNPEDTRLFFMTRNDKNRRQPYGVDLTTTKTMQANSAASGLPIRDHRWFRWGVKSYFYPLDYSTELIKQSEDYRLEEPVESFDSFVDRNVVSLQLVGNQTDKWFLQGPGVQEYLSSESFEDHFKEDRKLPIGIPIAKYRVFVHLDESQLRFTDFDSGDMVGTIQLPDQVIELNVPTTEVSGNVNDKLPRCLEIGTDPDASHLIVVLRDSILTANLDQLGLKTRAGVQWPVRPFTDPIGSGESIAISLSTKESVSSVMVDASAIEFDHDENTLRFVVPTNLTGPRTIRITIGEGENAVSRDYLATIKDPSFECPIPQASVAANKAGTATVVWSGGSGQPITSKIAILPLSNDLDVDTKPKGFGPVLDLPGRISEVGVGNSSVWAILTYVDPNLLNKVSRVDPLRNDEPQNQNVLIKLEIKGDRLTPTAFRTVPRSLTSLRLFGDRVIAVSPKATKNPDRGIGFQMSLRLDAQSLKEMSPAVITHCADGRPLVGVNEFVWDGIVYNAANPKNRYVREFCLSHDLPKDSVGQKNLGATLLNSTYLFPPVSVDAVGGARPATDPKIEVLRSNRGANTSTESHIEIRITSPYRQANPITLNAHIEPDPYSKSSVVCDQSLVMRSGKHVYVFGLDEDAKSTLHAPPTIRWLNPTMVASKTLELRYQDASADMLELEIRHALWGNKIASRMADNRKSLMRVDSNDGRFKVDFSSMYKELVLHLIQASKPDARQISDEFRDLSSKTLKRNLRAGSGIKTRSKEEIDTMKRQAEKAVHQKRLSTYTKLAVAACARLSGKRVSSIPIPVNVVVTSKQGDAPHSVFTHQLIVLVPKSVFTKGFLTAYQPTKSARK